MFPIQTSNINDQELVTMEHSPSDGCANNGFGITKEFDVISYL